MTLLNMVNEYQALLDRKEALAAETKENNLAIEAMKQKMADQMIDDDCPRISHGGYTYSLSVKTVYNKRSDAELAAAGVDFLDTLRDEGLGELIVEKVDPRTLSAAVRDYVKENGDLSEGLKQIVKSYDATDISRRKDAGKR